MMDEYIRREDAWSAVEQANGNTTWAERDDCHKRLVNLSSADVVPVVRCRDCRYIQKYRSEESAKKFGQLYECLKYILTCPKPNDFCSRGERREMAKRG